MSNTTSYAADWETKIAFMRDRGLTSAKWSTVIDPIRGTASETLTEAVCGPAPVPLTEEETFRETQPSISPQARQQQERDQRRGLAQRASGGPVRRLDAND